MQYGQPNAQLTTLTICKATFVTSWKTFQMFHILKVQIGQSLKKSAEYFFLETVYTSKSLFLVLGSVSVTEGITNCMI